MDQRKTLKKLKQIAKEFAKELEKEIKVEKIILFGSFAKGKAKKDSDLDLLIISPNFKKMDLWKRIDILARARKNYEFPMDYFGLTPKEYQTASPLTVLGEVKETGKTIFP
jgi:predicted nucleotidyltransferase